jgi:5-methylcytosine-specific restriction endonuclease McrBC GTP-binding regulatory subunit McrB
MAVKGADIDEHLYGIRRALEASGEYSLVDFYDVPEISIRWRGNTSGETQIPPTTVPVKTQNDSSSLARLAEELLIHVEELEQIELLLNDRRQLIFYGPPGTGKTYLAKALAEFFAINLDDRSKDGMVKIVQFHPSYAYEDFVQGYRPRQGTDGAMQFALVCGPLIEIAETARSQPDVTHVLIIDEINRGNVAKVLGELYFLLEYRDESIRLQYSNEEFSLPKNLWIIGTMNTADRSIALIDAALRRRFYFVSFFPHEAPIKGLLHRYLERDKPQMLWVAKVVDRANELLGDRHGAIGPSYFMKDNLDEQWVARIWKHAVMPYLAEQFFGEEDRLKEFELDRLRGMTEGSAETADADAPPQSE